MDTLGISESTYHAHGVLAGHGDGLDEDAHADEAGDVALVQLGGRLVGQQAG